MQFSDIINSRHSSRLFLPTPVPKAKLEAALLLAKHAPSNSNIQPWRMYLLLNGTLDRLKAALISAANSDIEPNIPPLPSEFRHFRSELGKQVYGEGWGISRDDMEARRAAVLRNFDFFGAPVAAIVCMDKALSAPDMLSVGMYLQTFLLGLVDDDIDSCVEVSVAGYPEIIREVVGIPEDMIVICGVAIGYEDKQQGVNKIRTGRTDVEHTTVILDK